MSICLNTKYIENFIKDDEFESMFPFVQKAHEMIHEKTGVGSSFLGWLNLPVSYNKDEFERIVRAAEKIKKDSKVLVVIGIGGSYLGARAVIEALNSPMHNILREDVPEIYFVGNSISPTYLNNIIKLCKDKDFSVNVISKSGTTTEPALAFRIFKKMLEDRYGEQGAKSRIYCTTDREKGVLRKLALKNGSVLTAVGLLAIAVSGLNINRLMEGAAKAMEDFSVCDLNKNCCYKYAAIRNILHKKGKILEMLVSYFPNLLLFGEWFKQLFGESEGKDGKGIFPASAIFSTDLHSLGQYIQEGSKILFETVINIKSPMEDFYIKQVEDDFDGLNFLANQNMGDIVQKVLKATVLAHSSGMVPNIILELEKLSEFELGYIIYFFEKACAMSGYLLGVNPFNQPGVESYKNNMFALLGKPGYEDVRAKIGDI